MLKEFIISIAGPFASLIFAFAYNNQIYFMINMCIIFLNMLPIYPLDGGRILKVLLICILGESRGKTISLYITNVIVCLVSLVGVFMGAYYTNFAVLILAIYLIKVTGEEIKKDKIIKLINYLQTDE